MLAPNLSGIRRAAVPSVVLELEPMAPNYRGFVRREDPVTKEQLAAVVLPDHFALEQQQQRGGAL